MSRLARLALLLSSSLIASERGSGRDHNKFGFSLLMAGVGFKPGYIHGATDDFGYKAIQDRV